MKQPVWSWVAASNGFTLKLACPLKPMHVCSWLVRISRNGALEAVSAMTHPPKEQA